jgi:SAM-dependent methyltransferase
MDKKVYQSIVSHYEACLDKHGDNHLGVDWPKLDDVYKRYRVMLDVVKFDKEAKTNYSLLDFGCGAGHLLQYIQTNPGSVAFEYTGVDISPKFIELCLQKFPSTPFLAIDALTDDSKLGIYDFIVMNGVFTEKRDLSFEQMWDYFTKLISVLYRHTGRGMAFNVMSKHVDWEREDLFHVPHDALASFLTKMISRNYVIRNDYGLYEYTVYIYK